jgi:malate/lactate dehydrogenase
VRSIVIVGAGELGGATARQLAVTEHARRIVLVDPAGTVAAGKALDIRQSLAIDGSSTILEGSTDESSVVGAELLLLADRADASGAAAEWQDDAGAALLGRVTYLNPRAMVICAGARQLDLVERAVRERGLSHERVFGTAPEALRAAVVSLTALEADADPREISVSVVGRPPSHIIVPWEDASIGGRRATEVLAPPALTRLDARLARIWPPGPLTLAAAAARVVGAIATRRRTTFMLFVAGADGHGRGAMLPARVSPHGVGQIVAPTLSTRDRVRLESALAAETRHH